MIIDFDKEAAPAPRRWWVIFRDHVSERERRWWDFLTAPDFRHCFAMTELTPGQVLVIDPLAAGVNVALIGQRPDTILKECLDTGFRVLVAKRPRSHHTPALISRGLTVTCASYLAYTLGLDGRPLTPQQLYRLMMRTGAKELGVVRYRYGDPSRGELQSG